MVPSFRLPPLTNETFHQNETTLPKKARTFIDLSNDKTVLEQNQVIFCCKSLFEQGSV